MLDSIAMDNILDVEAGKIVNTLSNAELVTPIVIVNNSHNSERTGDVDGTENELYVVSEEGDSDHESILDLNIPKTNENLKSVNDNNKTNYVKNIDDTLQTNMQSHASRDNNLKKVHFPTNHLATQHFQTNPYTRDSITNYLNTIYSKNHYSNTYRDYAKSNRECHCLINAQTLSRTNPYDKSMLYHNTDGSSEPISTSQPRTNEQLSGIAPINIDNEFKSFFVELGTVIQKQAQRDSKFPLTFSGKQSEDPFKFAGSLRRFFIENKIVDQHDKVARLNGALTGGAKRWLKPLLEFDIPFEQLIDKLITKFTSPERLIDVKVNLYSVRQTPGESVALFIYKKRALFARVDQDIPEAGRVSIIISQLLPEIRSRLRTVTITNLEELVEITTRIAKDIKDENQKSSPQIESSRDNNGNRYGNVNVNNSNREINKANSKNRNDKVTPPRNCRFCQKLHWERKCPARPPSRNCIFCQGRHWDSVCPKKSPSINSNNEN